MKTIINKTACITGATSGIGAAFAEEFAHQGYDLLITGRRQPKINHFAEKIRQQYHVGVEVVIADFSDEKVIDLLGNKISKIANLEILVNNAGYGSEGSFCEEKSQEQMAKLHVCSSAAVKLCHSVLPKMIAHRKGKIINVSSLSACFPAPGAAMYSATRAFLVSFTESLYLELKGTGVQVQVLCPGTTKTDFHKKLGFDPDDYYQNKGMMRILTTKHVVDASLANLKKDKVVCIPGLFNYFSWVIFKIMPRKLTYKLVQLMMKKRQGFKRIELSKSNLNEYDVAS
jgi:uncharacterized protein